MASKAALIEFLASTRIHPTTGLVWSGGLVGFFSPGTSTAKAVWLDRDKTLPSSVGQGTGTLEADGSLTVYGDGVYDIKIYDESDTALTSPIKTFSSVNIQDAQVGANLTDPDFLDSTDVTKIASWDMSQISSGQTRTITIPDGDTTIVGTSEAAVLTNKSFSDSTCKWVDNTDNTRTVIYEISGATSGTTTTLDFNHTANRTITFPDTTATLATTAEIAAHGVVQRRLSTTGALATGGTAIPEDDTIPQQSTEGFLFLTSSSITPSKSTNRIRVDVIVNFATATAGGTRVTMALFENAVENAIFATHVYRGAADIMEAESFSHEFIPGDTTARTFKVHIGDSAGGTISLNGEAAGRNYGGVCISSIAVTEYEV